jgi:hypothetical protein
MERPVSLKVIATLFFLVAAYLIVMGIAEVVSPGTIETMRGTGVTYGRELDGPQTAISVGAGWALVGWGLYRLQNWARWSAIVLMVIGVIAGIPVVSAAATGLNWRLAWYAGEMVAKVVAVFFLIQSPDVVAAFKTR